MYTAWVCIYLTLWLLVSSFPACYSLTSCDIYKTAYQINRSSRYKVYVHDNVNPESNWIVDFVDLLFENSSDMRPKTFSFNHPYGLVVRIHNFRGVSREFEAQKSLWWWERQLTLIHSWTLRKWPCYPRSGLYDPSQRIIMWSMNKKKICTRLNIQERLYHGFVGGWRPVQHRVFEPLIEDLTVQWNIPSTVQLP